MDNKNNPANPNNNGIKIDLSPEVASGTYSNLAIISHGPNEVFIDFISMTPNVPQARVLSRIIMTPENAKNLLFALNDNVKKYEATFGPIEPKRPRNNPGSGEIPNPFQA